MEVAATREEEVERAIAQAFIRGWVWRGMNPGEAEHLEKAAWDHADATMTLLRMTDDELDERDFDLAKAQANGYDNGN